jgi:fumarate reductase subunit C
MELGQRPQARKSLLDFHQCFCFLVFRIISLVFEGFHTANWLFVFATVSHFALPADKNPLLET